MYTVVPAISGKQLVKILTNDGWVKGRRTKHGIALTKFIGGRTKVAIIPDTRASLPEGTLQAILGIKQTGIGKAGLLELLNKS
jgi:predicted RNA binding protein YcfA (HicA-like mRNA interferase family)